MSLNTILTTFVSLTMLGSVSFASLLTKELSGKDLAGVQMSKAASAKVDQYNVNLTQMGAGLRTKKILVVNVKVYTAELFASDAQAVIKTDADVLATVANSKTAAMQLTFLRNVEAEKVQISFREALVANKVDTNAAEIQKLFGMMIAGGEAKDKKTMTFLANKNADGTDTLYFEDTIGNVGSAVGTGLAKSIFSMWLGTPADDGLKKLKEDILK